MKANVELWRADMKRTGHILGVICVIAAVLCVASMCVFASASESGYSAAKKEFAVSGGYASGEPLLIREEVVNLYDSPSVVSTGGVVDRELAEHIAAGCKAGLEEIPIQSEGYSVSEADLKSCFLYMRYDHPEIFYLQNVYSYSYVGKDVYELYPRYDYSGAEREAAIAEYEAMLDSLCAHAPRFTSDFEALLYYHDYIVANFEYDTEYSIYDTYNMLKQRKGVCQAYTLLYAAVLDRLGIENTAAISEDMNHVWNVVSLDGEWYFADLTWDDPIYDVKGRVCHYYFLCSEDFPSHHGWVFVDGEEKQFSDTYDEAFFKSIDCPMHVWDGGIYYLDPTNSYVMRIDTRTKEFTALFYVDTNAYIHGSGGAGYYGSFSGFCGYANRLYYSEQNRLAATVSIYEYDIETKQTTVLYTMQCEIGTARSVYGLFSCSNTIYYLVADSPNDRTTGTLYSFEVERCDNTQPTIMDVNGDGEITNIDLVMLVRFLSGWEVDGFLRESADANADDKINNRDAIAIIRHLAA